MAYASLTEYIEDVNYLLVLEFVLGYMKRTIVPLEASIMPLEQWKKVLEVGRASGFQPCIPRDWYLGTKVHLKSTNLRLAGCVCWKRLY